MKKVPYLVTYPRSGSHYFDELFYKEKKIRIQKSHSINLLFDQNNNKEKTIITIARDPRDSIASYIANEEGQPSNAGWPITHKRISQIISEYIYMYNFLYEYADFVVDFNDLVKYPDDLIKKILDLLKIDQQDYKFFTNDPIVYDVGYIASSKNLPFYNKYSLDNLNINLCYFYYNRLLEKKTIL
jgi:hypothetical protein